MNKSASRKGERPKYIKYMWWTFGGLWAFVFLFFFFLSIGWIGDMPQFEDIENPHSLQATEVISDDGEVLGYIGFENRSNVTYDQLSPNLVNALIATEDARFYSHSGIDARSLFRVLFKTVIGRHGSSGGGSTITQQLAKNLYKMREANASRGTVFSKLSEWVVAVKLEHNYSKQEILTMYLNTVDFGSNALGIKTASKTFFDKTPAELDVDEAAVLVGLLKAPTAYSPVLHPDHSLERRNVVLAQMNNYGYLSDDSLAIYKEKPIDMSRYTPQSHNDGLAPYLREYIRSYMKDWCKHHRKPNGDYYDVHKDGLKIYTTIDSRMQRYAEQAVREHFSKEIQPAFERELRARKGNPFCDITAEQQEKFLTQAMKNSNRYRGLKAAGFSQKEIREAFNEKVKMRVFSWKGTKDTTMSPWDSLIYCKKFLNAGLMSVEPGTGYVRAYVGGINYRFFKYDNVQSHRQVGSTFKPFVYTMALQDLGMYPCTEVPNSEVCFEVWGQPDWCPGNSSHEREGEMVTLKWALAHSINWVSAYLMKQGSPEQVVDIARKMGVRSPIDAVPAICVGTPEISVAEMAGAMATFANKGEYVEPIFITRIEDNKGMVLERFTPHRSEALSEATAYMMLELMKGVVQSGTGVRLNYKYHLNQYSTAIAGKTGTTQNNSDCWFVGITPKLATAVWTGGELRSIHFRNMTYGQGAAMALPIFGLYMEKIYKDPNIKFYRGDFERPNIPIELDCANFQQEIQNEAVDYEWDF
ncbi:MAG: transglycosylase domain-containing protein [Bacteroidales bacterium]|nr:transglycosylase domain-containing protein [Bacteroidales bacterium]